MNPENLLSPGRHFSVYCSQTLCKAGAASVSQMRNPGLERGYVMGPQDTQCTSEPDFDAKSALHVGHALSPVTRQGGRGTAGLSGSPWDNHGTGQPRREERGHGTPEEKCGRKPTHRPAHRPGPGRRAAARLPLSPDTDHLSVQIL